MHQTFFISSESTRKKDGILTGLLFITASLTAIIGLLLYTPLLSTENYLQQGRQHALQIASGAILELVLACANIGTAIMLFPYLKTYSLRLGIAYVVFRFFESIAIVIGLISMLSLLSLSQHYSAGMQHLEAYQSAGIALKAIHNWTFILGPHFFLGINTGIYSYVLLKARLVPKPLAAMGIVGAGMIFIASLLELLGRMQVNSTPLILMALPIALYEMILATWLIVKGYRY